MRDKSRVVLRDNANDDGVFAIPSVLAAAHELKAPLVLIKQLSLSLSYTDNTSVSEKQLRQTFERILLTSDRSLRLVELLTRSNSLQNSLFDLETVNMNHVCEDVAHELQPLARAMGVSLSVKLPHSPVLAVAHREYSRAIALHLCDNALTHADTSGAVELRLQNKNLNEHVRVSIRDHGPTVPNQTFRTLKYRLGRAMQPVSNRPQSSGLGLHVSSQLAASMNGSIGMIRHRTPGMTFFVELPASKQLALIT